MKSKRSRLLIMAIADKLNEKEKRLIEFSIEILEIQMIERF